MWIRKPLEEQLAEKKYKFNLFLFVICLIVFSILMFLDSKYFGINKKLPTSTPNEPLSWEQAINFIPYDLGGAAFISFFLCLFIKYEQNKKSQTVICLKCKALSKDKGKMECPCGGELVNLDFMKWIDNK